MQSKRFSIGLTAALAIFAMTLLVTGIAASQEKVLHNFGNGTDGQFPYAGLIMDGAGNLYGTTLPGRHLQRSLRLRNGIRVDSQWGR
jgi:hypothetical protein